MVAENESDATKSRTTIERTSDRELVIARTVNGPARLVFEAWTKPELFKRWWVPKSTGMTMLSCELDIRAGGKYRLVFSHAAFPNPMEFFGKYIEVTPFSRIVWTNDEGENGGAVTTVTFEDLGNKTRLIMHELYPTKEALDEAMSSGEKDCTNETLEQLEEVVATLGSSA